MSKDIRFTETEQAFNMGFDSGNTNFNMQFKNPTSTGDGENGATFIPYVSPDGVISWTNNGGLPNPEPVNIKGADGINGKDGANGRDGTNGKDGMDGKDGANGKDGYTPVKGTDYFTEADVSAMVTSVIAALPVYSGEVVTE